MTDIIATSEKLRILSLILFEASKILRYEGDIEKAADTTEEVLNCLIEIFNNDIFELAIKH